MAKKEFKKALSKEESSSLAKSYLITLSDIDERERADLKNQGIKSKNLNEKKESQFLNKKRYNK